MKLFNTRLKKGLAIAAGTILFTVILVVIFISPVAKYLIEKYDVKYSGREITLKWIYINPFTGYVHIDGLKIFENQNDSVFFSADGISVNFEMHKLLSKTCEISELSIDKPIMVIAQNKREFNFIDLIKRFSPDKTVHKKNKTPVHFNILNIQIKQGIFYYFERSIPVNYSVKEVNIETTGKKWDSDSIVAKFSLLSGIGPGDLKGDIIMNFESLDYKFNALFNKFDLSIMEQYLKDISNYGSLRANFDANVKAKGNFKSSENIDVKGLLSINDFHFGKSKADDYVSFKKFTLDVHELSPKNRKYLIDSVSWLQPYFLFERYDHLDNLQHIFGKGGQKVVEAKADVNSANILFRIADYVKILAKNFFKSNYQLKRLAIYRADFHYSDYTLNEKFEITASPFYLVADSIERSDKWVNLSLKTHLMPYGEINVNLSINPKDSSDFNIRYHLGQLPAAMFNPYLLAYTSFPLDRGTIDVKGSWKVNNGNIQSNNHLTVLDPRISKKQKKKGARWVPLKLIMFFIRERGNVIDYEIPITGDLKNPKFSFKDIITDAITNLFVKSVTTTYGAEVRSVENEIEKSFALNWELRKSSLSSKQEKFVEGLVAYLKDHHDIRIMITSKPYASKEKEYIMFFEAKKLYYLHKNHIKSQFLTGKDSVDIDRMAIRDSAFLHYLNGQVGKNMLFTIQDQCKSLISPDKIDFLFKKLNKEREKVFLAYFKAEGIGKGVKFKQELNSIPYNGFSFYGIEYKGEWPEDLKEAYDKMMELDNESPRDKFKSAREKNRKFVGEK
jgi:hypothetical protein